jgi:hypothetical protein
MVVALAPDVVLLSARWGLYATEGLPDLIAAIAAVSPARVVVVGPSPSWEERLPRLLVNQYLEDPDAGIPTRSTFALVRAPERLDAESRAVAGARAIDYVSLIDVLCTRDGGCLTKAGPGAVDVMMWDESHLTLEGSRLVADAILPQVLTQDAP